MNSAMKSSPCMPSRLFRVLVAFWFSLFCFHCSLCYAFKIKPKPVIKIEFNEKGQLVSTPPTFLSKDDKIEFIVNTTLDFRKKRVIEMYQRFAQTLKTLKEKDDKNESKFLFSIGLEKSANAQEMLRITIGVLSKALIKFVTDNKIYLDQEISVADVTTGLKKDGDDLDKNKPVASDLAMIQVPDLSTLLIPAYYVTGKIVNVNGLDIQNECTTTDLTLQKTIDCGYSYSGTLTAFTFGDGPVRFEFELRLKNNVALQVIELIKKSDAVAKVLWALNTDALKTDIARFMDLSKLDVSDDKIKVTAANMKSLTEAIAKKEKDGKTDLKMETGGVFTDEMIKLVYDKLYDFHSNFVHLADKEKVAWLLQFAWLSGAQNISANPFVNNNIAGLSQDIANAKKLLKTLRSDSIAFVQQIAIFENSSKAANSASNIKELSTNYAALLKEKNKNDLSIEDAVGQLNALQKKSSVDLINQLNRPGLAADSLFYRGLLYVNKPDDFNKTFFAFMRNHDALEDFQLKGKAPVRGINETQRLYILVDNANPKAKYLLKTTITPINLTDDISPFSAELSTKAVPKVQPSFLEKKPNPTLDDIYNLFETIKKLYAPYDNGVLTLPIHLAQDNSPDYITYLVPHENPFKAPSTVSYQLMDSASVKNVNSEGTTYTYRYNKLYRFRLKAGFVYSWLNNKNYSINSANNAASYTNNYTGLAPCVGLQIFTNRIDIQSHQFFPHGLGPFLYFGYIYTGAPAANILLGGGYEIFSGFAFTAGVHLGKSQRLTVLSGTLQQKDYFKPAAFVSFSVGLEAFNAIFNTAKPTTNPFK